MSEDRRTTEELLFELEQVKRADEDHFQSLLDDMEKIQAERDRLKAENAKLAATHDGHGAAIAPRGRAASPSPSAVRDRASGSTKPDPERAASHKEPIGRLTEVASTHKDRGSATEKAIAERRLRELAASGFRKRARSPERSQRARDPTPPRKERRRTSRSRSRTRSRDRQRPRSRGRDVEHSRDRGRQPWNRSDRDSSREHGQRVDQGRRRYSRSPHSPKRQSDRPSPQPSLSPPRQRGKDVLALPGPAQVQSGSAMTVLDPGFAEHLQSMVAPLAALGPALQGIVSMLQAVPAAISGLKMEMSERDTRNQQELHHITKQNQGLQDELSKVNAKIKTGSEIIDKNSMDVDKLKDGLEAEKTAAAERARRAEASSRALHEQQAQAGKALASLRKDMQDMPSNFAVDPKKIEEELTRLRRQVELLEAEPQQRARPAVSSAPAVALQRQQDETRQQRSAADAPAPSAGQQQHAGSDCRQSIPGSQRNYRKQHLPPAEPEGLADFAASVWGPGNAGVKPTLPPWLQQALEHISCKPAPAGATWPSRPAGIMHADVARAVSAALQHIPLMPAGSLQLNRQHPGLMQGVRPAGLAPGQPARASAAPIQPIVSSHASAARSQKQQHGSSWPPKGPGPVRGAGSPAVSQGAPPWVQEAQRVSDMLTVQIHSDRWQLMPASTVPQPSQLLSPAPQSMASLPAPTALATIAGPPLRPRALVPQSQRYIPESPSCSQAGPGSLQAPAGVLTAPLYSGTGASSPELTPYLAPPSCLPYVPTYSPAYLPTNPSRQHPSLQASPARPAHPASAATGSPSRPAASMAVPSKPRLGSLQQPSAAAAPGKASESIAQGPTAVATVPPAARQAQAAMQQSPALSGAPSSQGPAPAKQGAALAGASMSQAHAKVPNADKLDQQMPASQPSAVNPTGSAARQDSLGTGPEGARGSDSRGVEAESKNQRRKRQREEAEQAAGAAPAPRSQQTPEAQSKRAKSHHEQAAAQQVSAVSKVHAMALLNADFICGVCERAYSNSAAFHLHLLGNEHQLKLSHPKSRQGKAGEEGGSLETVEFRRSFPWNCKLCGRNFAFMRQLVDHSSNSDKHTQLLQAALRKDRTEAREDGEVAGSAPILSGQALRDAWAKQNSTPADHTRQVVPESPSKLRVVVLDDSTAPSGSKSTRADQREPTGQAAKVGRDAGTKEGWQYESPQHAAHHEGSRHQSREGSVEDGELPRVPVHFALTASKPVTPQSVQPSAQPGAQPTATAAQKPSPAPSDRAIQAPTATSAPTGPDAPAQQNAAAAEKDSFLPPHLKGLVSPNLKAPTPLQSGPPKPSQSAGITASKAAETAMLQPQKQQRHAGHQARAPAAAPKASGLAKQPPSMPASTAMPQASAPSGARASVLQSPKPTPASASRSSATLTNSSARTLQASVAKQASGAAGAPAGLPREPTDKGHRASAGAASQLGTPSASVGAKQGMTAGGKASASAGSAVAAATPVAASKGQPASLAKGGSVSQKPSAPPAAAGQAVQGGHAAPPVRAAASAALPTTSVPVPAEAIAAATSFLNDLGNARSSPSEAPRKAPSGSGRPAAGQLGSMSRSAQQTQPALSLPKLPAHPPSPEMRLESLMQELSNMAHRLPDAAPAEPRQKPAGPSLAAPRAAAPSASSLQQAVSRTAGPASGMPYRASAPPRQPQQAGRATAGRSIPARQGTLSDADVTAATEKLRKQIAELNRVIDVRVREAKRKGTAGKAVPPGPKQPAQASQAAPGSAAPTIAKAKAEVPQPTEQPSKGPSAAPNLASKQPPLSSAPVPGPLVAQGEQDAPAQSSKAAEHTSKLALAGHSTGKQTPQAAAPARSPSAADLKQSTVAEGHRAAERASNPASGASAGEAMTSPARAAAVAPQKQHGSTSDRAKLAPKQPPASCVSNRAKAGGTQPPSSRPSAPGSVPPGQPANPASGPQVQSSQPSAAPVAEHPAAEQVVKEPQQIKRPQMPGMLPPLKQADTSSAGVPRMHASAQPPTAHDQGGPAAASQPSVKASAVPTSHHGPAQPSVTPALAGKESVQLAVQKDGGVRLAMSQPSASAGAATRAAPSQAQPVMPDVTPASDKPQERAARPTAGAQPIQPDTHTKAAKAAARSAEATPPAGGSVRHGTHERPARSAEPVAKQREQASSTALEDLSGREAPDRVDSAAAPLRAGKGNYEPVSPEMQGSLPAMGHLPATPLPVLALEDNRRATSPSSSGTPAYTMLTQTPLGTGSAWPAAAQDKAGSQPAPALTQQRKTVHLTPTLDSWNEPTNARAAAGAGEGSLLGSVKAGQPAKAAGQTSRASSPYGRTPDSGHRAARGRIMTTGRRPVQASPKRPSPPGMVAGNMAAHTGAASEASGAQAGSSARHQTASGSSAGSMERSGGRAGHMRSHLGTSSQSGRSLGHAEVAGADGHGGIKTTGSGEVAGVSSEVGRNSAVGGVEQVSGERQQPSNTAKAPVGRAEAGDRLGTGIQESHDTPAEAEDMDIDIMTVPQASSASHLLEPRRSAASEKAEKQLQGTAKSAAAGSGSTQHGKSCPASRQTGPVAAAQSAAGHEAGHAPAASPATGRSPARPQPASDAGIRAHLSVAERPSPGGAAQPRKHGPALPQSAGQGTGSSATAKAALATASMSKPAAARPAALPPQPQNPETTARRAVQPPARAAPLTVQQKVSTREATQAESTSAKPAAEGLVPKAPAPPKVAAPSLQQKKPLEALPKPGVAPQHKSAEATSAKAVQIPVTSKSQGQRDKSALKTLPKPPQAPAKETAAATSRSSALPPAARERAPTGISKPAPAVKNPAGAASLAKAPSPAPSKVPIPAPKQAAPASSAPAVQAPSKYSFLYPQKEDSTAAKSQKLSRFATATQPAALAPQPAPFAQKVHTSRVGAASASAGGAHRPQPSAGQGSAQGQSSKRVVTISHESHAGNGMSAQHPRSNFEGPEPGEMRMPLQMPPMPVHMHPLQGPSQGAPFSQERPEDPRYLPRQAPLMEWFHPESMSMASLPQPWHVHEMQMSSHRGHTVELQGQQHFGAPDGRVLHGEGERQQGMHLPPQLPPLPMHMPPGEPQLNSQGHFPQQFLRDEGMGRSEHYGMAPGLPPGLGGPDFGRPHSQGFGMYGTPEQLPFPPS